MWSPKLRKRGADGRTMSGRRAVTLVSAEPNSLLGGRHDHHAVACQVVRQLVRRRVAWPSASVRTSGAKRASGLKSRAHGDRRARRAPDLGHLGASAAAIARRHAAWWRRAGIAADCHRRCRHRRAMSAIAILPPPRPLGAAHLLDQRLGIGQHDAAAAIDCGRAGPACRIEGGQRVGQLVVAQRQDRLVHDDHGQFGVLARLARRHRSR